jgi:pimeloyl-ACP methyl ester carboxylesterase
MVRYWSVMKQWLGHSSLAVVLSLIVGVVTLPGISAQTDPTGEADFTVFLRGERIGTEHVAVTRGPDGWTITASGNAGAPLNFSFDTFVAKYAADWQTRSLEINGQMRGQPMSLQTTFANNQAVSNVVQSGQQGTLTHKVSAYTISLPNNFFSAYEALAIRLNTSAVGDTIPVYVAPQTEMGVQVQRITPRRMETPTAGYQLRQFDLMFPNQSGPLNVEVWVDGRGRLARLAIPVAALAVIRDDLTSVMARLDSFSHSRDQNVFIPANGFNLAATFTPPAGPVAKAPVVILLSGSGAQDRDETVFGIPILGQVAGRLSDAGYFVVRYDKRGVGQSGGRIESASIQAYAEDARAVLQWVRQRRDIDRDRVAVVGHSEGGAVALLVAGRDRGDVDAIGLLAAPGTTGREVTLAQQRHALDRSEESAASKQEKIDLQTKLMDATISGKGWETVPPELRKQADTLWFRSWLSFDPADAMRRTNQPVLIVQGALDSQIPPSHADALERLASARSGRPPLGTRKVVVPGVNHLLVPATTGEANEYPTLADKNVSMAVTEALITWLNELFAKP